MTDLQSHRDESTHLRVLTKKGVQTFRRLGRAFGEGATDIPLEKLSDEEVKLLRAEPRLRTSFVTLEPRSDDDEGSSADDDSDENDDGEAARAAPAQKPTKATKATKGARKKATSGGTDD